MKQSEIPVRFYYLSLIICLIVFYIQLFDENGKVDQRHCKVNLDPNEMLINPPTFAEVPIDFDHLEVDPRENPLYIQYSYMTKGLCPPQFYEDDERFQEDVSRKQSPKEANCRKVSDYIQNKTKRVIRIDAENAMKKEHIVNVSQKVEDLRRSGKPFYWVDIPRLNKLKQIYEAEKNPDSPDLSPEGKKAF